MENEREYPLPSDVVEFNSRHRALIGLRDKYATLRFSYKRAKKASIEAEQNRIIFWERVVEIYPEIKGKNMEFNAAGKLVQLA